MEKRKVEVYQYVKVPNESKLDRVYKCMATFHQFGVDYKEFETGPGNYSTAIVEYENGEVKNVPVELIKFIN